MEIWNREWVFRITIRYKNNYVESSFISLQFYKRTPILLHIFLNLLLGHPQTQLPPLQVLDKIPKIFLELLYLLDPPMIELKSINNPLTLLPQTPPQYLLRLPENIRRRMLQHPLKLLLGSSIAILELILNYIFRNIRQYTV